MVAKGVLTGTKPLADIPDWMGGGDPNNDSTILAADSSQPGGAKLVGPYAYSLRDKYIVQAGSLGETVPLETVTTTSNVSGALNLNKIALPAGLTIGHINFCSGSQPASTPTHWWFALLDGALSYLATTPDQTTTPWPGNTIESLAIATVAAGASSTFRTTYSGLYYLALNMVSSNNPSILTPPASTGLVIETGGWFVTAVNGGPPAFPASVVSPTRVSSSLYGWVS